jgi:hypothetical protein
MFILLPLALIGAGVFITLLFNAATYALPLAIGAVAALACAHAGSAPSTALLIGFASFMLVIGLTRFIALIAAPPIRIVIVAAMAIPAAIAGYQLGHGLAGLSGLPAVFLAVVAAILTGMAAAIRTARPAS